MVSSGLITYNNRARGVIISGMINFTPRISVRFYWIGKNHDNLSNGWFTGCIKAYGIPYHRLFYWANCR